MHSILYGILSDYIPTAHQYVFEENSFDFINYPVINRTQLYILYARLFFDFFKQPKRKWDESVFLILFFAKIYYYYDLFKITKFAFSVSYF